MDFLRKKVESFIAEGWLIEVQDHVDLNGYELILPTAISEQVLQGTRITRDGKWDAHVVVDRARIKRVNFYDEDFHKAKRPAEAPPEAHVPFDSIMEALKWAATQGSRVKLLDVLEHENTYGVIEAVEDPYFVLIDSDRSSPIKEIRLIKDCEEVRFGGPHLESAFATKPKKLNKKKKKGK